ncbi:MAG: YbgC/FadM family acyl-CoA thioesterase, partial [Planifilum fulgidum]
MGERIFETSVRVRYKETDQMGVVHHTNYIVWFEVGRTDLLRQLGLSYRDLETRGILLPVVDLSCRYAEAARYDDEIRVLTRIADLNPGKIVRAPRMDDRRLFRYPPGYRADDFATGFDWSAWPGRSGGLQGAVEMCNNNGACRKHVGGVMCPSYRVTRNERDVTRGRANTLRLALTGQLGADALMANGIEETLKLCVSCKACRRECPTGVDMAKMKAE